MPTTLKPASVESCDEAGSGRFVLRLTDLHDRDHTIVLHGKRGCDCGCGGSWDALGAKVHLHNTVSLMQAGLWTRPDRGSGRRRRPRVAPTFATFATRWLQSKSDGTLGPCNGIAGSTYRAYRWALGHLLPFFGDLPLNQITRDCCLEFKTLQLRRSSEVREALGAGADIRDRLGRRAKPLSPSSIRKLIDVLGAVLQEVVDDGFIVSNPARGRRMQIRVRHPPLRQALEIDELATLLVAADQLDRETRVTVERADLGLTTRLVQHHLQRGRRPAQIAAELGLARSTVSWHLRRLGAVPGQGYVARSIVCELLGRTGLRSSELRNLRIGDLRLDAPTGAYLRIRASKTEAGVREVQMTPALVTAVKDHLAHLRQAGMPLGPHAFLVPSTTGTMLTARRVRRIVTAAWLRANELRSRQGHPPLPDITPHALRRTYVSIALLANGFDVKWVMGQVGHADSRMTLDVYAQLMRRVRREHGVNFDRLLRTSTLPADAR